MSNNIDRARLETDDEESHFPPTEPTSFRPSFRPAANAAELGFWNSRPPSLAPMPSLMPSLPAPPRRTPSPARAAFAKVLFTTLFGGMALLLAFALVYRMVS